MRAFRHIRLFFVFPRSNSPRFFLLLPSLCQLSAHKRAQVIVLLFVCRIIISISPKIIVSSSSWLGAIKDTKFSRIKGSKFELMRVIKRSKIAIQYFSLMIIICIIPFCARLDLRLLQLENEQFSFSKTLKVKPKNTIKVLRSKKAKTNTRPTSY